MRSMLTGSTFFFDWEVQLMEWLQAHMGPAAVEVISAFSALGEELLLILILGMVYWGISKKKGRTIGLGVLLALVAGASIKNIFLRRRPYFDNPGIQALRPVEKGADLYDISAQGYSFPSMHSANAATAYGGIAYQVRKRWMTILAGVFILMTGISRVCVGVHYPTDVLAGWCIGLAAVFLAPWLEKKIRDRRLLYAVFLLTAVPGFFFCRTEDFFTSAGLLAGFLAGSLFEETFVRFENTDHKVRILLRVLGGTAIYVGLNTLLKLPFPKEFLEGGSYAALMVRFVRYMVIAFVEFGIYPMAFKAMDRYFAGRRQAV